MDTEDVPHIHDRMLATQPILPLATTWMPCRHYAKRGKSENKRQLLHSITYTWDLKRLYKQSRMVVTRAWGGNGEMMLKGTDLQAMGQ